MEIWKATIDLHQSTFRSNTATSANTSLDNFGDGGGLFLKLSIIAQQAWHAAVDFLGGSLRLRVNILAIAFL